MRSVSIRVKFAAAILLPETCLVLCITAASHLQSFNLRDNLVSLVSIAAGLSSLVGLTTAALLSRNVCGALQQLAEAASLGATGMPIKPLHMPGQELARLADSLGEMSRAILARGAEVTETQNRLHAVLTAAKATSIVAEDLAGNIAIFNPGAEVLLGCSEKEVLGRNLMQLLQPVTEMTPHSPAVRQMFETRERAFGGEQREHETVYTRRDGLPLQVYVSVTPLMNMNGHITCLLHVAHDISSRIVLESELRVKNERLRAAAHESSKAREMMSASVSRLKGDVLQQLSEVQNSLKFLRESASADQAGVLVRCQALTEYAFDAVRQISDGALPPHNDPQGPTPVLPEFVRYAVPLSAAQDKRASVGVSRAIDNWYEKNGEIPSPDSGRVTRSRVLVLDDFEETRALVRAYLKNLDCELTFAGDGIEALDRIATERFDLVLMDIEMPRLDGYETARCIRGWEEKQGRPRLPLIALTAHADLDLEAAKGCHWNSFLRKPLTKGQLVSEIQRHIATYA